MATANVLLIKPVDGLGAEGDEAKVKAGYARNYLVPQKLAVPLTAANRKQIEALKKARDVREAKDLQKAEELKGRIESVHVAVQVRVGEENKMFGAVTAPDLLEQLAKEGLELDRKQLQLAAPIKELGKHTIQIKIHPEVVVDFEFEVVPLHEDEE
jgi:large subunit ribosomal protein L9